MAEFFRMLMADAQQAQKQSTLHEEGETIVWEYDFGDSWEHDVRLSSFEEYAEGEPRQIVFVGGKRVCPPEDCGGVRGYEKLLELRLPHHTSHMHEALPLPGAHKS